MTPSEALLRGFEFETETLAVAGRDAAYPAHMVGAAPASRGAGTAARTLRQGFRIGTLNLMIGYEDGSELTELPAVYRLPNAAGWFAGMANLHGRLVPVFDLARRFAIDGVERARAMLLVLAHGPDAAGVIVDGIPERLSFDAAKSLADEDCIAPALRPFVRALHSIDSRLWLDLDVRLLLDALEHDPAISS